MTAAGSSPRSHRVFVYGTLRRGESHAHLLDEAEFLGEYETGALFTMFDLGEYPAVVAGGGTAIAGEVFAVSAALLARLDAYEGCPGEYARVAIDTPFGPAWIYVHAAAPPARPVIAAGDWRTRRHRAEPAADATTGRGDGWPTPR